MGLLHIYCGDGKGKTTAALGLAIRAAGAGMKVHFTQFLKGDDTAELHTLEQIPSIIVRRCDRPYGFFPYLNEDEKALIMACHNRLLEESFAEPADLVILDEFNATYALGALDRTRAETLICAAKPTTELVLTGRDPAAVFLNMADYISEICCKKHPYDAGIDARRGIEY